MNNSSFSDSVNIASLILGIANYQENLTQNDKQEIMKNLSDASDLILKSIETHLEQQDKKIDYIIKLLERNQTTP